MQQQRRCQSHTGTSCVRQLHRQGRLVCVCVRACVCVCLWRGGSAPERKTFLFFKKNTRTASPAPRESRVWTRRRKLEIGPREISHMASAGPWLMTEPWSSTVGLTSHRMFRAASSTRLSALSTRSICDDGVPRPSSATRATSSRLNLDTARGAGGWGGTARK